MANFTQICKPSRLNLDKSSKYLQPHESSYLLNHDVNNVLGKATPMAANYLACDMQMPAGENYSPNNHYSPLTNENYTWHYNSNNVHFISRINGEGTCEIVYNGECLKLSAAPQHQITQFRAILDQNFLCNKVPNGALKRLVWTDGINPINCIDVEASIATNFFTTPFFDICGDECAYIQLCVPEVEGCIVGEWVPVSADDNGKGNLMLDKGFKYAIRQIYYDGRANELSDRSTLYFQDSKGCFDNSDGYPRCMKFRLPVGNPMVEKIEFYVSENGGLTWFLRDTIEKYKKYNSAQQYWYQRDLSETVSSTFSEMDCSFDYIFCNDKQRIPADPKLLTRVTNPIPREAQGLFRIKDTIAAFNYVSGTCPVDKNELDKITIELNCNDTTTCNTEYAKVTVRAIVYTDITPDGDGGIRSGVGMGGYVYRANGNVGIINVPDDIDDPASFGSGYLLSDQQFRGKIRNFMPYIEGTDYWGQMKQYQSTANFTSVQEVGVLARLGDNGPTFEQIQDAIKSGDFFFQEYIFNVPKGMKGYVRLASHYRTSAEGSANQATSTNVLGMLGTNGLKSYNGNTQLNNLEGVVKEMYFDTCGGDFDSFDAFIVHDLRASPDSGYAGYITDKNKAPVEGAQIYGDGTYEGMTDFNGFYFFHHPDDLVTININVEQDCSSFSTVDHFDSKSGGNQVGNVNYEITSIAYQNGLYAKVEVPVKDCNNLPIRGIRVAMSGSKYKITDSNGIAHFRLRNFPTRNRSIVAVVMDNRNCFNVDCFDNCNPCMPSTPSYTLIPCFIIPPTSVLTMNTNLNINNIQGNRKTLKKDGIYEMGVVIEGDCGKISAVYPITTWNIPRLQETGSYSTCTGTYNTHGALFPLWGKKGKIVRSSNQNPFVLQWLVDEFERTTDGKLILTIQSLNDYNKRYNFKTNTVYQFVAGDRIEFIRNGDGKIFDIATNGILNYQVLSPFNDEDLSGVTDDVDFFNQIKITDDGKLESLTKGAIIQISHLALSTPQVTYYEVCANFFITNGVADIQTGTFETFDTYLVNRQIDSFPPQYFEHKSPSDFWGEIITDGITNFLSDIGKVHFLNSYENEKRYQRNISINSATQMNYFGDTIKTLDAEEQGYITAISVKDDKIGLAVCQNDNFLFQISDDLLRLGSDNIVMAAPADSIISNPEPKIVGQYGCLYQDIGSILFGDGYALWFDGQANTYIIHNYSFAKIAASYIEEGKIVTTCNSYFKKRNREKENFNKSSTDFLDHYRYSTGINKGNSVVYLTLKSLRHAGINNEQAPYLAPNETLMYHPATDSFLGFASFTCEGYSELSLDTDEGCSFLTFQNSLPYIHELVPTKWNEFYGIAVDLYIGVTLNKFPDKVKIPLALEMQSDKMFFAKKVTTDKPTFLSEIPPIKVKLSNSKWNAALLNDINSRGGLFNGANARGYFVDILLCRDNTINLEYNSINDEKREQYSEVDQIIVKFELVEQSGMTSNV